MKTRLLKPSDPYDTPAWMAFYAENPGYNRSVGAEGVNDDDDDGDENDGDDDKAAADAAIAAKEKAIADSAAAAADDDDKDPAKAKKDDGPSDEEARLLKDMMKYKKAAREAQAALKSYEGVDAEEYKALKKDQSAAKQKELESKGQFDEVKRQIVEAHEQELTTFKGELSEKDQTISDLQKQIEELTVGSSFSSSTFLTEQTLLPPAKARAFYGNHFEIEDGQTVAYDKPKGSEGRAPLVDGRGNPLPFEAAIEKIVRADPDSKQLLRSAMKPGADSKATSDKAQEKARPMSRQDKIKNGLGDLFASASDDPFKEMMNGGS